MSNSPEDYAIQEMVKLNAELVKNQTNNLAFLATLEKIKLVCEKTRRCMSFRVVDPMEDENE